MRATRPIIRAHQTDLPSIRWLLALESLPSAHITEEMLEYFLVYRDAIGVAGTVGLELHGYTALLHSLAIADGYERARLGRRLVAAAGKLAKALDMEATYLLLTPRTDFYFGSLGYRYVPRENAPSVIQKSAHFRSLCRAAVLMVKP